MVVRLRHPRMRTLQIIKDSADPTDVYAHLISPIAKTLRWRTSMRQASWEWHVMINLPGPEIFRGLTGTLEARFVVFRSVYKSSRF